MRVADTSMYWEMSMKRQTSLGKMQEGLQKGSVYRRSDFTDMTSNVDRNLAKLVESGFLKKLQNGLYLCPKKTPFGESLPNETELLEKFLNDDHFVVYGPSMFNSLGQGQHSYMIRKLYLIVSGMER